MPQRFGAPLTDDPTEVALMPPNGNSRAGVGLNSGDGRGITRNRLNHQPQSLKYT